MTAISGHNGKYLVSENGQTIATCESLKEAQWVAGIKPEPTPGFAELLDDEEDEDEIDVDELMKLFD